MIPLIMKTVSRLLLLIAILVQTTFAKNERNVILVTMDGVRWDEIFKGSDPTYSHAPSENLIPNLTGPLSKEGVLLGDELTSTVSVENQTNISLPGYQNIFLGRPTSCESNWCLRVCKDTITDELRKKLNLKKKEIAAFTSWGRIRRAWANHPLFTTRNFGLTPFLSSDPFYAQNNEAQRTDLPPWGFPGLPIARFDKYTYAAGYHYLTTQKPRFMYIGMLDSDESAHASNYDWYMTSIRALDTRIMEIVDFLKSNREYGDNTLLIVTTDHGRGEGDAWTSHGAAHPHSKKIWMYVRPPVGHSDFLSKIGTSLTHSDIRKIISAWMLEE